MNAAAVVLGDELRPARTWVRHRTRSERGRELLSWATTAAFIVVWFFLLRPDYLGGATSYVIVSGRSMEGTFEPGDLVVARRGSYEVGDVVVFRVPDSDPEFAGRRVVHRIVGGSATEGFEMRGDATSGPDFWRPTADEIVGEVRLRIPRVAHLIFGLRAMLPALTAAIVVMAVVHRRMSRPTAPAGEGGAGEAEPGGAPPPVPSAREQLPRTRPHADRARGRRSRPRSAPGRDVAAARRSVVLRLAPPRADRG